MPSAIRGVVTGHNDSGDPPAPAEAAMSATRRKLLAFPLLAAMPGGIWTGASRAAPAPDSNAEALQALDRFVAGYCAAMNAPGLTLGLAALRAPIRASCYGYVDLAAKIPVTTAHLFEIGSITKSFVALVILQLREEGKLDLQSPIRSHLPWLAMQTDFGDITIHHLLTHSSGMPDDAPVFPSAHTRPRQAYKPGATFHYSNWGYEVLGYLIESIDGRPWAAAVAARILKRLGMDATAASINSSMRPRLAQSYVPLDDDRTYPRHGALAVAGILTVDSAAGSIASTPGDMISYMRMILSRGTLGGVRIVSEESFKLFSAAHIAAPIFGSGASYGYGIAVDKLDGHVRLRHTGGMVSFMSAIHLDLDAGFGAFASINAQLDYRPNPVAEFALQVLRASRGNRPAPAIPDFDPSVIVQFPRSFTGTYTCVDGRRLIVAAAADRIHLEHGEQRISLQQTGEDTFIADHPDFDKYPLMFERDPVGDRRVVALAYGSDWYAGSSDQQARALTPAPELARYSGKYYSENPWHGLVRVVQRQRQLWIGGTNPLTPIGDHVFRVGAQNPGPETAEFSEFVDEVPRVLWFDGGEFRRVEDAEG